MAVVGQSCQWVASRLLTQMILQLALCGPSASILFRWGRLILAGQVAPTIGLVCQDLESGHSQGLPPRAPLLMRNQAFSPRPRSLRGSYRQGRSGKFRSLNSLSRRGKVLPNASNCFALGRVHRAMLSLAAPDERLREGDQCGPFQCNRRRVIALWLAGKLLKTKDAVRLALDGLGTNGSL